MCPTRCKLGWGMRCIAKRQPEDDILIRPNNGTSEKHTFGAEHHNPKSLAVHKKTIHSKLMHLSDRLKPSTHTHTVYHSSHTI